MKRISDMTAKELFELGFRKWDESGLMLIPASMYKTFPRDIEVTSIGGGKHMPDDMDDDQRFGCLAYGIFPKE